MAISRANCLSVASFRPAGIHLCGGGNPPEAGKAVGDQVVSLVTFFRPVKKVTRLAGRDRPKLMLGEQGARRGAGVADPAILFFSGKDCVAVWGRDTAALREIEGMSLVFPVRGRDLAALVENEASAPGFLTAADAR